MAKVCVLESCKTVEVIGKFWLIGTISSALCHSSFLMCARNGKKTNPGHHQLGVHGALACM